MRQRARSHPTAVREVFWGIIDPKPEPYRGAAMRSKLEVDFAVHLDALGIPWAYEPRRFGPGLGYLPDFLITNQRGEPCYVEVKPTTEQAEAARARMEVIWESRPEAVLLVVSAEQSRFYAAARGHGWETWTETWKHS